MPREKVGGVVLLCKYVGAWSVFFCVLSMKRKRGSTMQHMATFLKTMSEQQWAGPLRVSGLAAEDEYPLPLATTEAALVVG